MAFILAKLREPSTWAGIAGLAAAIGWTLPPDYYAHATQAGIALASIAAIALNERKP